MSIKKINFTKIVASGNDFILLDQRNKNKRLNLNHLAKEICDRKFGIGADGLLVLESSKKADIKMRIFNSDGSEAEMCGNGARCVAYYISRSQIKIETKAGILEASVDEDNIKIKMTNPTDIRLNSSIKLNKKSLRFNFINTGVPHAVFLCEGIEKIDVHSLGRLVRYHKEFKPRGTNVNFIEPIGLNFIKIRTYERGVEDETLACGTGSVAAAIIYFLKLKKSRLSKLNFAEINVKTVSGEELKVFFDLFRNKIKNVWLEGKAKMVFTGDCYV